MGDDKEIKNISIGSSIQLSFDIGKIEHPVYGIANLSGSIPLLLPYGVYVEPAISKQPERIEAMVKKLLPEYRDLWENYLDKEICAKLKGFILGISYSNPMDDIATPKMQTFLAFCCLAFATDDVWDNLSEVITYKDMKNMIKSYTNLFDGVYESVDELISPIPAMEFTNKYSWKFFKLCELHIPDFYKNNQDFKQEYFNLAYSFAIAMEDADVEKGLSPTSKTLFGAYQSGMLVTLEFIILIRGIKISDEIRRNILFQRMKVAHCSASHLMNDIFGCGRDIRLNQVKGSSILINVVHKGIPLQIAYDNAITELCNEINDVKIAAKKLRECYWDDENLLEYINCTERMLDGELYAYEHGYTRYGDLNLKVEPIVK